MAAKYFGIPLVQIAEAFAALPPLKGRMEVKVVAAPHRRRVPGHRDLRFIYYGKPDCSVHCGAGHFVFLLHTGQDPVFRARVYRQHS